MLIREEEKEDEAIIYTLVATAFKRTEEAELVDALRAEAGPVISLVAEEATGIVVGHVLFSEVALDGHPDARLIGLAPMSVLPEMQGRGIGTALGKAGLGRCRQLGYTGAVVLGDPGYYSRFGFRTASGFGLASDYDVPDDYFMATALKPDAFGDLAGKIHYHAAFSAV